MSEPTIIRTIRKNALEDVVIVLTEFKGHHLCDIRVYADFTGADDQKRATKKGVCVKVGLIPKLIEALEDARAKAQRRGLIKEEGDPAS